MRTAGASRVILIRTEDQESLIWGQTHVHAHHMGILLKRGIPAGWFLVGPESLWHQVMLASPVSEPSFLW